jgi:uncharacterized membrane protein HdeD (DUF308 family)
MSIGGKNKGKDIYSLVECLIIGIILFSVGIIAFFDYFVIKIVRIFDWGKYQVLIGIILVAIGAYYIFKSFKGYED